MPLTPDTWLSEFTANLHTTGVQKQSNIIQLTNGNILVVWTDQDDGGAGTSPGTDLVGQIFDPFGNNVGGAFQVNAVATGNNEENANITALADGGFLVVYQEIGGSERLVMHEYSANGTLEETQTLATNTTDTIYGDPVVASSSSTSALIVYSSTFDNPLGYLEIDVVGRIFNPATNILGPQIIIADSIYNYLNPVLTALTNGDYAVAYELDYESVGIDDGSNIRVDVLDSVGNFISGTVVFDGFVDSYDPDIAALAGGGFAVAWTVDSSGGTDSGIRYQVFDSTNTAITGELSPATTTAGNQGNAKVVALEDGNFVILWDDDQADVLNGRHISTAGAVLGSQFTFETSAVAEDISATGLEDGRFALSWSVGNDIRMEIFDTRDNANAEEVYPTDYQIGTIGNDSFSVSPGARRIDGYLGDDFIFVNAADVDPAILFDGGAGDDTLAMLLDGLFNFTGETVQNFEKIQFAFSSAGAHGTFLATQIASVDTFAFNSFAGSVETLSIFLGGLTSLDLSGVTVENYVDADDRIIIFGESASETITGTHVGETIFGDAGNDTINGGNGEDFINGGTGNDTINGGNGADSILGGDGADIFLATGFSVVSDYDGGAGIDVLDYSGFSFSGIEIDLLAGTIEELIPGPTSGTITEVENLIGTFRADRLTGDAVDNTINGGDGDDRIEGGEGADNLFGEGGSDTIAYSASSAGVTVEIGTQSVSGGDAAGDTITGFENAEGSEFVDTLTGDANDNVLTGLGGNDLLNGGGGNDILDGGNGLDTINGGAGDDVIATGFKADLVDGGAGIDWVDYSLSDFSQTINLTSNININGHANGDNLTSIENVLGSGTRKDDITGNLLDNILDGQGGNDILRGGRGDDTLLGGDGKDALYGGKGADVHDGGDGRDWAKYNGSSALVEVDLVSGGTAGIALGDTYFNIENIRGTDFGDTILGNDDDNKVIAGQGDDIINGRGGKDALQGNDGNDTIIGGTGNDTMRGQGGNDVFVYSIGDGVDKILDFDDFGDDQIDLSSFGFTSFADVQAVMSQSGSRVILDFAGANVLRLENTDLADMGADDFILTGGAQEAPDNKAQVSEIPGDISALQQDLIAEFMADNWEQSPVTQPNAQGILEIWTEDEFSQDWDLIGAL